MSDKENKANIISNGTDSIDISTVPGDMVVIEDPNGDYDLVDRDDMEDYDVVYDPLNK